MEHKIERKLVNMHFETDIIDGLDVLAQTTGQTRTAVVKQILRNFLFMHFGLKQVDINGGAAKPVKNEDHPKYGFVRVCGNEEHPADAFDSYKAVKFNENGDPVCPTCHAVDINGMWTE